ncbi:MAG: protein kinase domain-containing protein [Verrucomicrobiota bacterium]
MYDDHLLAPWFEHARAAVPEASLFDVHTHIGANDPDGFKLSVPQLVAELDAVGSRAVIIPMHEPTGYAAANEHVVAAAAESGGKLVAFCRVNPAVSPVEEARRSVDAGARGIKLHPRAEQFQLADDGVEEIFAFAHERRLPILIHAGRGIPALAHDVLRLAQRYPDARVILGHSAICDLAWVWRELPRHRNVFIDTSWWGPSDLLAAFALVPPSNLLWASDLPYMTPRLTSTTTIRCGVQVGLSPTQLTSILGGQAARLLAGEEPLDLGPAPGDPGLRQSVLLRRVGDWLALAIGRMLLGDSGYETLALARLACDVGDDSVRELDVFRSIVEILDRQERFARENPDDSPPYYPGIRLIWLAAVLAVTPDVGLPTIPGMETVDDLRRRSAAGHRTLAAAQLPPRLDVRGDLRRSSAADHVAVDPEDVRPSYSGVHRRLGTVPDLGPGDVLGGYRLGPLLGEGGMGKVFRATAVVDGRQVALKVLRAELSADEDLRHRFRREARAAAEVQHPNLLRVLDLGEADGREYLAIEFVDGETLESRIARTGPLSLENVLGLLSQIAPALDELHAHGLTHRDLKSSNILLDHEDTAFLTDFGLAKGRGYTALTRPSEVVGTLDYLAPEIVRGEAATAESDVYALGCVVFECLAGQPPFADKDLTHVGLAHLSEEPPDLTEKAGVPPRVSRAALQALEKEPAARPRTATDYAAAIRAAATDA